MEKAFILIGNRKLRNMSRGKGVGFFEAGNFHPDFIRWMVIGGYSHDGLDNEHGRLPDNLEIFWTDKLFFQ